MAKAWAFSNIQHVRVSADNLESFIKKKGLSFSKACDLPLPVACRPDLDVATDLSVYDASRHQYLIQVLRWIVEIGIVCVCLKVSIMDSCAELSREVKIEMLCRLLSHLKKHHNTEMVLIHAN